MIRRPLTDDERRKAVVVSRSSFVVALITLFAFALRLYHLDAMSFWSDEGISVLRARADIPTLIASLPVEHTPLYFVGLHLWMRLLGEGDFAVRYFSLVFGVLAVPLVYKLGVAIIERPRSAVRGPQIGFVGGRRLAVGGLLAALLAAINPLQIWYAQEARMYSLVVALCAGAAWCLLKAVQSSRSDVQCLRDRVSLSVSSFIIHPSSFRYYLAFALLGAAALYTHFFAALILAALGSWALVVVWNRRALWRPLALAFGLIGLLFLPWLPRAIAALSFPGWQTAADPLTLPARYLVAYTLGSTIGDEWQWLALGFLALIVVGVTRLAFYASRSTPHAPRAILPIFYVGVPFTLMMLLALRKPGYHERYLIVVTPMLFVILAAALDDIRITNYQLPITNFVSRVAFPVTLLFVLISAVLSLSHLYFDATFAKPDFRAAAQYLDRQSRAGDGLIFDGPDPYKAFYRYFSRQRVAAFDETDFDAQDAAESEKFLSEQVARHERWWVVLYFHPTGPTEDWLLQQGYLASSRWFNGIRVLLYATPSEAALRTSAPIDVQTHLPLQIVAVRTRPQAQIGDVLPLIVRWQANGALPADYQASVRLVNGDGQTIKQLDRRPLDGRVPTSQWKVGEPLEDRYGLLVPEDAVSGDYHVQLILYRLNGDEVLRAQLADVRVESPVTHSN